ncbi:hypothetical protein D3C81_2085150 [compost metagenome]
MAAGLYFEVAFVGSRLGIDLQRLQRRVLLPGIKIDPGLRRVRIGHSESGTTGQRQQAS